MGMQDLGSRAIVGDFYAALEAYLAGSWIEKISWLNPDSDQESETYKWLGMTPAMREWIGGRQAKGLRSNGLTIFNKKFEATVDIPLDWLRRDKTGQIRMRIGELADRAGEHWGDLLSTFIANGTGATSGYCYDGKYFFDSDHSEGASGTQSNLLTSSEVSFLNVTTATAPTATEVMNSVLGVIAHMMTYKDDQGKPMNANAKEFLVMVAPYLMGPFMAGLFNAVVDSGASNTIVAARSVEGFNISLAVNPLLTWTTNFAVFRTDARTKAMIRQQEVAPQMKIKGAGSDYEFDNDAHQYGVDSVDNGGSGDWQYAAHATLS